MTEGRTINITNGKIFYRGEIRELGLHIVDGLITTIRKSHRLPKSDETFNAKGKIILPGLIDVHAHLRGLRLKDKETFETGTMAALAGGITTVLDMQNTDPPTTNPANLKMKLEEARKEIMCDIGFFASIPDKIDEELPEMVELGIMGFKVYPHHFPPLTIYDEYEPKLVDEAFSKISKYGLPVCVHAKSQNEQQVLLTPVDEIEKFLIFHAPHYEREAIKFYSEYARKNKIHLHISHLSSEIGLNQLRDEKLKNKKSGFYLFNWEKIPGSDNGNLIEFIKQNFSIDWIKAALIEKINLKTIKISTEENSLSLRLNDEKTKVTLKIDDYRTDEFIAKTENGMLNIYKNYLIQENKHGENAEFHITADVAPHHLFLTEKEIYKWGTRAKMVEPLRTEKDVEALWSGLKEGIIDIVASEHAPHRLEDKDKSFSEASSGVPGLETMLPLMYTELVLNRKRYPKEKEGIKKLVEVCCNNPAREFNLYKKGKIERGYFGDLVIMENKIEKIDPTKFFSKAKYSPFKDREVKAKPFATFLRGSLVYYEGTILAKPGSGNIIRPKLQNMPPKTKSKEKRQSKFKNLKLTELDYNNYESEQEDLLVHPRISVYASTT